jgi:hypothetical protein
MKEAANRGGLPLLRLGENAAIKAAKAASVDPVDGLETRRNEVRVAFEGRAIPQFCQAGLAALRTGKKFNPMIAGHNWPPALSPT